MLRGYSHSVAGDRSPKTRFFHKTEFLNAARRSHLPEAIAVCNTIPSFPGRTWERSSLGSCLLGIRAYQVYHIFNKMVLLLAVCHLIARSLSPYLLAVATCWHRTGSRAARRGDRSQVIGSSSHLLAPVLTGSRAARLLLAVCHLIARRVSPYCSQSVTLLLAVCHLTARSLSPYCSQSVTLLLAECHLIARSLSPYCSQSVTLLLAVCHLIACSRSTCWHRCRPRLPRHERLAYPWLGDDNCDRHHIVAPY